MSSEEEGERPSKRTAKCRRIPYVLGDIIVYGCDRCMPPRDTAWITWRLVANREGMPRDLARYFGEWLEKRWVEWENAGS